MADFIVTICISSKKAETYVTEDYLNLLHWVLYDRLTKPTPLIDDVTIESIKRGADRHVKVEGTHVAETDKMMEYLFDLRKEDKSNG